MKYDLRSIMIRAWKIKKRNKRNIFALCLKMSWKECKDKFKGELLNAMLHKFCKLHRPTRYYEKLTTLGMLRALRKSEINLSKDIEDIVAVLYPYMLE